MKVLIETKLKSFFSVILGGTHKTLAKPNPERIFKILQTSKSQKENTVMIGDSLTDYETCSNAGIEFIFFENGYDDGVPVKNIKYSFNQFSKLASIISAA